MIASDASQRQARTTSRIGRRGHNVDAFVNRGREASEEEDEDEDGELQSVVEEQRPSSRGLKQKTAEVVEPRTRDRQEDNVSKWESTR